MLHEAGVEHPPEDQAEAAEQGDHHQRRHQRPRRDPLHRGAEGRLHRLGEPPGGIGLAPEGLHGVQPVQRLAGEDHRHGELLLGPGRKAPHPPPHQEERHDHRRAQQHDEGGVARGSRTTSQMKAPMKVE